MAQSSCIHVYRSLAWFLCGVLFLGMVLSGCEGSPEKRKLTYYQKGVDALKKNDAQAAVLEFKNALEIDSAYADAYYQLGLAYTKLQEFDKAVIAFGNAAAHDPKNVEARLEVANYYLFRQQDMTKARQELEKILQDFPENPKAYTALGTILYRLQKSDEAITALKKALASDQKSVDAAITLGQIYLLQGKESEAQQVFTDALNLQPDKKEVLLAAATFYLNTGKIDAAKTLYEKALAQDASDSTAAMGLAEAYLSKNEPKLARSVIEQFQTTKKEPLSGDVDLRIRFLVGRSYLFEGNFQEAMPHLQIVSERLPDLMMAQYSYGLAQAGLGKFELAIAAYQRALRLSPDHLPSLINLAIAQLKNGDAESAQKTLEQVLSRDPSNAEAVDLQGMILMQQGRHEAALEQFIAAERLAQQQQLSTQFLHQVQLHHAMLFLKLRQADEALAILRPLAESESSNVALQIHIAKALSLQGNMPEAIATYQRVLDIDPSSQVALLELSLLYIATQQYEQARKTIEPLVRNNGRDGNVLYVSARIDAAEGKLNDAKEKLQRVAQETPTFVEARYALAGVYKALNDEDGAIKEYEGVLNLLPSHLPTLTQLAYIKMQRGVYDDAILYANRALRIAPDNMDAIGILSTVYAQTKQFEKAIDMLEAFKARYPESPSPYLSQAAVFLYQGSFEKTIELSLQAIERDASNPSAYEMIGRAYFGKNEKERAREYFQKALAFDPKFVKAYIQLGMLEVAQNKLFDAIRYFRQALDIAPDAAEAMFELGKIYQRQQRYDEAIAIFEKIPESSAVFPLTLEPLLELYMRQANHNKLINLASSYLKFDEKNMKVRLILADAYARRGDVENAANSFREITISSPEMGVAWVSLGILYLVQNRIDLAMTQFDRAIALEDVKIEALFGLAIAHQFTQNYQQAISDVQTALEIAPDNLLARFLFGNIYISQKSFSEAAEQFQYVTESLLEFNVQEQLLRLYYGDQAAVSAQYYNLGVLCASKQWLKFALDAYTTALWRTENNPFLHYAIGNIHKRQDKYQQALQAFEKVKALEPSLIYVDRVLAELYQRQQQPEKAIEMYKEYLRARPDDAMTHILLGLLYENKGEVAKAIAEYREAIRIEPNSAVALNQLAWTFAERKESLDDALQFAQQAVSLSNEPGILDTLGWVYYQRGEFVQAIEQFQLALQQDPFQPTINYHLGLAFHQMRDIENARKFFERVLELSPNGEHSDDIHRLLEEGGANR